MHPKIPLSLNTFDTSALSAELQQWEGRPHTEILEGFEAKLCELTKSPYAVALSSGTAAIHLALKVSGVEKDDQVPVSSFTYIGSVNPICYQGAQPVFIDSEKETWNLDPNLLEDYLKKISTKEKLPKVIEVVHTYGMPAKMKEIMEITSRYGVSVIEDAASGLGGSYYGNALGTIADIGILSFNNNKTITTFGGGALLTNSRKIYDRVKFLATQARENKPYYEFNEVGFNYRMGPLNAIYGLAQLMIMHEKINARRVVFEQYRSALRGVNGISFQNEPTNTYSSRWLTAILLDHAKNPALTNERIIKDLTSQDIECRYLWKPMHIQPMFKDAQQVGGAVSEMLFKSGLCLPSGSSLAESEIERIARIINPR